jgi:hypothetical protein
VSRTHTVISLATATGGYGQALRRLEGSVRRVGFDGEFIGWRPGTVPAEWPEHSVAPFAFKPFCLEHARREGRSVLLWIDASSVAVRSLEPLFERIERDGYLLVRNRDYAVGEWASDLALERLGLGREEAFGVPELNAAVVGLDLASPLARAFLTRWLDVARDGVTFRGVAEPLESADDYEAVKWNVAGRVSGDPRVLGHRHDQTAAGVIAHELGLRPTPGVIASLGGVRSTVPRQATVLKVRGAGRAAVRAVMLRVRAADRLRGVQRRRGGVGHGDGGV